MSRIATSFFSQAEKSPDKEAIWCEGVSINYGSLEQLVRNWEAQLAGLGMRRGDHVGILLDNSIAFVALMLVAADLGLVLVPLASTLPRQRIADAFKAADVTHVIGAGNGLDSLMDGHDDLISGIWMSVGRAVEGVPWLDPTANGSCSEIEVRATSKAADPYILTMTSGSTGDPKPIVLTQATKYQRARSAIGLYGVSSNDRILAATPLYHSLAERLAIIAMITGATLILKARFSAIQWMQTIHAQGITFTIAVSSQLQQVAEYLETNRDDFSSSLRCLVSSSALLDVDTRGIIAQRLGCDFHECYGTSEVAIATSIKLMEGDDQFRSVGKAVPEADIVIIGPDDDPVGMGEEGEIACRSTLQFSGYYKHDALTKRAFWNGYFRTGDIGVLDRNGFLHFRGRCKEVIISGGINIYPVDIEEVALAYPYVVEAAAFSVPDARLGEVVGLAVIPLPGTVIDVRALRLHCANGLADFQIPRRIFAVDEFPRNEMGKMMRAVLCSRLLSEQQELLYA